MVNVLLIRGFYLAFFCNGKIDKLKSKGVHKYKEYKNLIEIHTKKSY